jgi:uncharacterized protein YbaR (Trm112 family)
MAIRLDCPRCKTPLHVPGNLAGGYANCPRCKGRLWVPKDAPEDATRVETIEILMNGDTGPAAAASITSPEGSHAAWTMAPWAFTPPAPASIVPHRRVARLITAESADSTLKRGDDGQLPELHLAEDAAEKSRGTRARPVPPLALLGILGLSVAISLALVLYDGPVPANSAAGKKAAMRQKIEDHYFGSGTLEAKRLEPYQLLLREAQQAQSRGDDKTERQRYHKVLDMLRAERGAEERGLTGSRSKDKELEEAISVLLGGG